MDVAAGFLALAPAPAASAAALERVSEAHHVPLFAEVVVASLVALALAWGGPLLIVRFLRAQNPEARPEDRQSDTVAAAGLALATICGVAGLARALLAPASASEPWVPDLDAVTISWFALALAGAVLPFIPEITFGGVTLKLRRRETVASKIVDDAVSVLRDWTTTLNQFTADVRAGTPGLRERLEQFVLFRLREGLEWLGAPDDRPRLSVWLANDADRRLEFAFSNEIVDAETREGWFGYDEGVAGASFTERIVRNEINPDMLPTFKRLRSPVDYKSLLVVPIGYGDRTLGVLCVDRRPCAYFEDPAISVMKALAQIVGAAIGLAEESRRGA